MEIKEGSEDTLDDSPIMMRETEDGQQLAPTTPQVEWDKASAAAILRCLFHDGSFSNLKSHTKEMCRDAAKIDDIIRELEELTTNPNN